MAAREKNWSESIVIPPRFRSCSVTFLSKSNVILLTSRDEVMGRSNVERNYVLSSDCGI